MSNEVAFQFARESLMAFACLQWSGYKPAAHHLLISKYLEKVERGEINRLIIQSPPRSGKSMIVSTYFPAWFLGKNPDKRIACASYAQELASDFGRSVRNQFADPLFETIFPGVKLSEDSAAVDKFDVAAPRRGGYVAVGVGGALTGRGAHCFVGETMIQTDQGLIPIKDLIFAPRPVKVLSFSLKESTLEYKEAKAFAVRSGTGIYRITTSSGRMVEVTGDHKIFVRGSGYLPANKLAPGDPLVCVLQEGISTTGIRSGETHNPWAQRQLLFKRLLGIASCDKESSPLQSLREACREKGQNLLRWVSAKACWQEGRSSAYSKSLPSLQYRIYGVLARIREVCKVLQETMFGNRSFIQDVWERKFALDSRIFAFEKSASLRKSISTNEKFCFDQRQSHLRFLQDAREKASRPSFGWKSDEQFSIELGHTLRAVSSANSCSNGLWAGHDQVESVVRVRENAVVYDIQVADNHNLFADGILCHNCLLIDDPIKGRDDSDSEANSRRLKDWYTSVAYTRLQDDGAIIICQTRWSTDDLAGWVQKEHAHENWVVLNLPAINENGEALWPERFPLKVLNKIKKTLPARDWEALYQQKPFVESGDIYKKEWWRKWPEKRPMPECSFIIQSYDTAFSQQDKKSSSFSARIELGVFKQTDDDCESIILLGCWKDRVDYPTLRSEAVKAYNESKPDKVIIERKASGQSLIQDLRRASVPITGYVPDRDKISRAYMAQSLLENGRCYYPDRRWAEDSVDALARFPNSPEDMDVADAFSQAIIWLQSHLLVAHSADAERRRLEDEEDQDGEDEDDFLPSNVRRLKPKKRAAYA